MNKNNILEILKENSGKVISGGYIALRLNISRNAVWKNINILKEEGYNIVSVKNKGYMLDSNISYLNRKEIEKGLNTKFIGNIIEIVEETDSTINYLKNLKEEEKTEGRVIIANSQTSGKGRRGRPFFSPKDSSMYLSLLLKPKLPIEEVNIITIICGLSVVEALKNAAGIDCDIKWVNDIYKDGLKLCGILTEGIISFESGSMENVVLGVGININRPENEEVPEEFKDIIGFVQDFTGKALNRNKIISEFLNVFESKYLNFDKNSLYKEYKEKMLYINEDITYIQGNEKIKATLLDLNKDFSIKIKTSDGEIKNFNSGEISIRSI
ncbi:biotin--[acetyl-CoA-carboxylase] ligase [Anaerofustis stercorihominis]|uniref:biotin--[acetyl-CoA-carboxylase] ligase n=1 Tax=Anaerofustis stercorihominis TaxID=214853 RepID=UPI00214B80F6|nr:biotin--[acetyl-CoA-carboxylase] ligase [Anaerofustis stercorihominis]MCR2032801.1 biotin--[acetyl-CoA-carboxylase] ligase [Anaerofustis stercorihominis]